MRRDGGFCCAAGIEAQGCACAGNGTGADDSGGYSEGRKAAIRRADAPDWPVRMHRQQSGYFPGDEAAVRLRYALISLSTE